MFSVYLLAMVDALLLQQLELQQCLWHTAHGGKDTLI